MATIHELDSTSSSLFSAVPVLAAISFLYFQLLK